MNEKDEGTLRLATPEERAQILCDRLARVSDELDASKAKVMQLAAKLEVYRDLVDTLVRELRGSR